MTGQRRYPIGAEPFAEGTHFRVWSPTHKRVSVVVEGGSEYDLEPEQNGYFSSFLRQIKAGARYQFRLDGAKAYPDPASRFQPDGPHGPSEVIDANRFAWSDAGWKGRELPGLVIYELHVGTFTHAGTWAAATKELSELARIGINCIEIMPLADFGGEFGWGYDGVNLFAPTRLYGTPDDFRAFVDAAHALHIAVLLDVVYNHFGPDGNYLGEFAPAYFTDRYKTDWGSAINFDGPDHAPVREYFLTNVQYWIQEFHLDGLRLDATQNIYDDAPHDRHILTEITARARSAAPGRVVLLIAENEPQASDLCRSPENGGNGLDCVWNDDYHHSAMVALTGRREAYYTDYLGSPQEFISAAKYGYLYQGQWYSWQKQGRGQAGLDLAPAAFVSYFQNHDQIANSGRGLRAQFLGTPARYRAMMALTLLLPGTPMLFQGQEFASSKPFFYFADHDTRLSALVEAGRVEFLHQFPSLTDEQMRPVFAPPHAKETFERCKLDFSERVTNAAAYKLTHDLLQLRQTDAAFRAQSKRGVDGAVLGASAFVLRYFQEPEQDRLLIVNFGIDLDLSVLPEPLLAPPAGMAWQVILSTEEVCYAGCGVHPLEVETGGWHIPADCVVVLGGQQRKSTASTSVAVNSVVH